MKIQTINTLLIFGLAVLFAGCGEDEVTTLNTIDTNRTAIITGKAYATTNATLPPGTLQFAPAGTKLVVTIDSKQFAKVVVAGRTYELLSYPTTVSSDGSYTVTVPALSKTITATVIGTDFKAVYVASATASREEYYSFDPITVTYFEGLTTFQDIAYDF
jgi:hypothetical protein